MAFTASYSRADLWVYAAKVAIEYTTEQNNFQCGDSPGDWVRSGHSVIMGKMRDCMRNKGEADCEVGILYRCRGVDIYICICTGDVNDESSQRTFSF